MAYKKIALALSGGGARALAHIGVLKVLEQEKIPIHSLSGCSIGAILAACFAKGYSAAEVEERALAFSSMRHMIRLVNLSPARRGWLEGRRVRAYLEDLLGAELTFADLNKPLAINAVDLVTGEEIVFREGPILPAVMGSIAVPGIFVPVKLGEYYLVDGGVLDNLPVGPARALNPDVVIAVDVQVDPFVEKPWRELTENNHWPLSLPASFLDVYRSILIMIAEMKRIRLLSSPADLLLQPPIPPDLDMFLGFRQAAEAIAAGEQVTRQNLPRIKELVDL